MAATLKVNERGDLRRSVTREIRNQGSIPGVVYGKNTEPVTIAIDSSELLKNIREYGKHAVYTIALTDGSSMNVMLYDFQEDPMKNEIIHVDFYQVDMSQEVEVEVAIKLEGHEKIKDGVMQQTLHELQVRAKPNDIPEFIQLDISDLKIGDTLTIGDLIKDDSHGFEMLGDEQTVIVSILPPQQNSVDEASMEGGAIEEAEDESTVAENENEKEK